MTKGNQPRILIAGAGAMGVVTGYYLALSGTAVTFLIRPERPTLLRRPQSLYCYDDGSLKSYERYGLVCDTEALNAGEYDYVVITLDSAALRDSDGERLTRAIGRIAGGTSTGVILGAVGIELRRWFLSLSKLTSEQVTNGTLGVMCHNVAGATLPLHPPTNPALLAQADFAYRHCFPAGFAVDDSAPALAERFAALYSANNISPCVVQTAEQMATFTAPIFAQMAACNLAGWPRAADIDPEADFWQVGTAATQEIQRLRIHGETGRQAAEQSSAAFILDFWRNWERDSLPLDLQEFNRFHHGGKVSRQDLQILNACIMLGEAEGQPMTATRDLLVRQKELTG